MLPLPSVAFQQDDYHHALYPLPATFTPDLLATEQERWDVLASIGITPETHLEPEDSGSPLAAWRNAVADVNGVPRSDLRGNLDLGFSPAYTRKFAFYLA